ncbi:MAG: bifunctional (p)ppGpp synthetase/guanosine-3',5'-bis(diphosphate) 3'-pyrophosphohydrolase [Candidatus Komeilibacteria bacterium]|jgi:GTP diphosphokinase / guanosine-3',5'-bis(diphosphate) 3'-diphosphatase|nr:bifunctional (p)ppGpp synthetase/guanosine-3',5'-bis(diphosphate) 3'-pyrophosphohydrolase [Candidatus Komeilibacteria bacterium]MBT4447306.1 bifunctional (p)ppGpp synthetase/guanosine-3',5'-bis(diphosphate) 3'-pyrophosphohydrolase [Candidatus Komeilibacteria bacterium]
MKTFEDLKKVLTLNYREDDIKIVIRAFHFASEAHKGQKRRTGEDYIYHSIATAYNLAKMKMDIPSIAAGLLHDVPEDTDFTFEDLKNNFGKEIYYLVKGVTKLGTLKYRGLERYAENLRKMFLAMSQDLRVIIIKLADRMHNMETLEGVRPEKRLRIAQETLEIYAPLANRLGMFKVKTELEDLAFPYVYPEEYKWTMNLIEDRLKSETKYISKIKKLVQKELAKNNIEFNNIRTRIKSIYSIYQKLLRKGKDINKIYDLIALRIIVADVADCYSAMGVLHKKWTPLKGRVKDYIAQSKPNGYQSLHTSVFTDFSKIVEIQIRTIAMDEEAEYGIAAHSKYKEIGMLGKRKKHPKWLEHLIEIQKTITDNTEFIKHIKNDLFLEQIFVFTPKGDVVELPENATPLDFAYYIHTDIGNQCVGAKINHQMASLDTLLKSGDVIEIITDKNRKKPNADWLNMVATSMAKSKIKSQLNKK